MSHNKKNDAPSERKRGALSRFLPNRRGSVSIEFAMLAIPFVMLIMAIIETSVSFAAQQIMANAADDLARELRTGRLKPAAATETVVRQRICDQLSMITNSTCPGLYIDLKSYTTFAAAAVVQTKFTSDNDLDTTGFAITPGGAETKNMLRVYYKWPVMLDLMRKSMSNIKGGNTLLMTVTSWQNEPYD